MGDRNCAVSRNAAAVAVVCGIVLTGCGSAHVPPAAQSAQATHSQTGPPASVSHRLAVKQSTSVDQGLASAAASAIDGQFQRAPVYGGVWLTGARLTVAVTGSPSTALRAAIARQSARVHITVVHVAHSYASLRRLTTRLSRDDAALRRGGIELSAWGADVIRNKVMIGMRHYSKAKAARLVARYGAGWVYVTPHSVDPQASGG